MTTICKEFHFSKFPNASGIYKISSRKRGKIYVGSAINLRRRRNEHLSSLRRNVHRNDHLQKHFNKHGENDLHFEILEECAIAFLIKREQHYLDSLNPDFNVCLIASSSLGVKHSEEFKKKISEAKKGNTNRLGILLNEEGKEKMRNNAKINPNFGMRGKKHSLETIAKMRHPHKPISEQGRKNMSVGAKFKYLRHAALLQSTSSYLYAHN